MIAARRCQSACAGATAICGASEISIGMTECNSNSLVTQSGGRNHANVRQIAIALGIIKSVAHHKFVWNGKADVIAFNLLNAASRFVEQGGNFQTSLSTRRR